METETSNQQVKGGFLQPQQGTQQQQSVMFYPERVLRSYTASQWGIKEDWYTQTIQRLNIPVSPTPADIANVAGEIERLLSTARLDMAYIEQAYEKYDSLFKIQTQVLKTDLTNQNVIAIPVGEKLTVASIESYVAKIMTTKLWTGSSLTLFDLKQLSESRYIFMNNVIKLLCDKKDLLITHNSVIKAEVTLNGMTNNVPQQPQRY